VVDFKLALDIPLYEYRLLRISVERPQIFRSCRKNLSHPHWCRRCRYHSFLSKTTKSTMWMTRILAEAVRKIHKWFTEWNNNYYFMTMPTSDVWLFTPRVLSTIYRSTSDSGALLCPIIHSDHAQSVNDET